MDYAIFQAVVTLAFLVAAVLAPALLPIARRRPAGTHAEPLDRQWLFATRDDAFERIVKTHESHLRSVLAKRVHPSDVDDVLQELWVVVRAKMDQVERLSGDLLAWLVAIAKNLALNDYQKRRVRKRVMADWDDVEDQACDPGPTGEQELMCNDIKRVVDELDPKRRAVMKAYLDGESVEAIAKRLKIPKNTCHSRLHRARLDIRHALARLNSVLVGVHRSCR